MNFKQRFYGKCVLAGEHSVLRGAPALVFPLRRFFMDLEYRESEKPLQIHKGGDFYEGLEFCLSPLLETALSRLGKSKRDLKGVLKMDSFIPFGAGLGASAALSVSLARLLKVKGWLTEQEIPSFATDLENIFHGTSSGMDVAVVLKGCPVLYQEGKVQRALSLPSPPCPLFLSYCGRLSSTSFGVKKVADFFEEYPEKGRQTDKNMKQAVSLMQKALYELKDDGEKQASLLRSALTLASACFETWGLLSSDLTEHINQLRKWGARAAKPTGSGEGGYVISLWNKSPPSHKTDFIPLF